MIKNRWIKKQESKPAPEISSNLKMIKIDGIDRYYIIHIPKKYDAKKSTPLLLALHGGGGNMKIQATDEYYKLISKSESAGFIAVFPNGHSKLKSGEFATWNAGNCCGDARDSNVNDVKFIREVIKEVSKNHNIDSKKVFAIGMSNGGMMSYRLACEMSDVLAGIASVAGTDNTIHCSPSKPISILHLHAKDDDHILFNGGAGKKAFRDLTKVTHFVSVPATIEKWLKLNQCAPNPKRLKNEEKAYCDLYSGCKDNVRVQLCVTEDGGHSWPGGRKPRNVGGKPSKSLSANEVIWDFFYH